MTAAAKVMAVLAGLAGAAAAVAAWMVPRSRVTPEERERRRRLTVSARGRTAGASITDYHDGIVSYSYSVGGVEYAATQDVSMLKDLLPEDPRSLIGRPASLKFLGRNPANSILLSEEWSGLRFGPRVESASNSAG
jgi:hypothetical protein